VDPEEVLLGRTLLLNPWVTVPPLPVVTFGVDTVVTGLLIIVTGVARVGVTRGVVTGRIAVTGLTVGVTV
tara:strand:+ start:1208 stop:1417 length:210 start_codon:yes stop_codon:yes gene_type:complete